MISAPALHLNNLRNVAILGSYSVAASAEYIIDTGGDPELTLFTCESTTCHGGGSPEWLSAPGNNGDCSACHGMADTTLSPPNLAVYDTDGDTAADDNQVGAHDAHINGISSISAPIACSECHNNTKVQIDAEVSYVDKVNSLAHLDGDGVAELSWGSLAKPSGASPISYNSVTGVCSNYCHGNTLSDSFGKFPTWTDFTYLSGVDADCEMCHGAPPIGKGHTGDMTLRAIDGISCGTANCHDQVMNTDGTFLNKALHIDGTVNQTATCATCHPSLPPNSGSHVKHGDHMTIDLGVANGAADGALTDWLPGNYETCSVCHDMTVMGNHIEDDGTPVYYIMGTAKPDERFADDYPLGNSPGNPIYNSATKSCMNTRCHFMPTPQWDSPSVWPVWTP